MEALASPNTFLTSLDERVKFFSVPVNVPPERIDFLIGDFKDVLADPTALETVHKALHQYFITNNFDSKLVKNYYFTFWRWYVEATFARLLSLEVSDFVLIFSKQLPAAFQLNIAVENDLFYYFFRHFSDESKLVSFFQALKKNLVESKVLLHPYGANSPTLFDVAQQYTKMKSQTKDTLAMADYLASIQRTLFPVDKTYEFFDEAKKIEITKSFLELVYFFAKSDTDIVAAVNNYIDAIVPPPKDTPSLPPISNKDVLPREPKIEVTLASIQSQVDAKFEKDETGQYKDIEGVFAYLDALAEDSHNDEIREFLYFDEQIGGFVWKQI